MKLFEVLKFDYSEHNKKVIAQMNDSIKVPVNSSGFSISIEVLVNKEEILESLKDIKNLIIENNTVKYSCVCENNEVVMSIYDYSQRNFDTDNFILNFKKLITVLNMWEVK